MKTALFIYPTRGEFGWEVIHWQGFVRKKAKSFDKSYVICPVSSRALYQDIAGVKFVFDITNFPLTDEIITWEKDWYIPLGGQDFKKYGIPCEVPVDVLIHARNARCGEKNYPVEKWNELVQQLLLDGLSVASIGKAAHYIEGTYDLTGESLEALFDYMCSAKCIVGPSSGPMHLATLCGCPQVVWGDERKYVDGYTLKQRYNITWNPFETPVHYIETKWDSPERWQPEPFDVLDGVRSFAKSKQFTGKKGIKVEEIDAAPGKIIPIKKGIIEETVEDTLTPIERIRQSLDVERELNEFLRMSRKHGKFFITVSYKTDDMRNEFKHFWVKENFSEADVKHCLGHINKIVEKELLRRVGDWK